MREGVYMNLKKIIYKFGKPLIAARRRAKRRANEKRQLKEYSKGCVRTYDKKSMPKDYTHFKVAGESVTGNNILITPHTSNFGTGYITELDCTGKIVRYKHIPKFAFTPRKFRFSDGTVYYVFAQSEYRADHDYDMAKLVVLDGNFETVNDDVRLLPYGSIKEDDDGLIDPHDYVVLGKNHFILMAMRYSVADNIPGFEGRKIQVKNIIIQEQKDGEVVFQFETNDHPELFAVCGRYMVGHNLPPMNFENYIEGAEWYADPIHLNSMWLDRERDELLLSMRQIGLVKISHRDGSIKWVMGRRRCDISGVTAEMLPLLQHDARGHRDGTITVFDNMSRDRHTRICEYKIDEDNLKLEYFNEYISNYPRSFFMGNALRVGDGVYQLAYGGGMKIGFEECDFKSGKQNMKLVFDSGDDMYQVFSGEIEVEDE